MFLIPSAATPNTVDSILNIPIIIPGDKDAVPSSLKNGFSFFNFALVSSLYLSNGILNRSGQGIWAFSLFVLLVIINPFPNLAILLENRTGAILQKSLNQTGLSLVILSVMAKKILGFKHSFHFVLSPVTVMLIPPGGQLLSILATAFDSLAFFSFPPTGKPLCSRFSHIFLAKFSTTNTNPLICIPAVAIALLFSLPLSASFVIVFNDNALLMYSTLVILSFTFIGILFMRKPFLFLAGNFFFIFFTEKKVISGLSNESMISWQKGINPPLSAPFKSFNLKEVIVVFSAVAAGWFLHTVQSKVCLPWVNLSTVVTIRASIAFCEAA